MISRMDSVNSDRNIIKIPMTLKSTAPYDAAATPHAMTITESTSLKCGTSNPAANAQAMVMTGVNACCVACGPCG